MALRGGQDEGRHAADACVRACRAIERVLSKEAVDREVYREAETLLQMALLALDAANHAIMGSASETKRGRTLPTELLRLADEGEPSDQAMSEGRRVARQLDETARRLKRDLVKLGGRVSAR